MSSDRPFDIGGLRVEPGEQRDVDLRISQTSAGSSICIPVRVVRAREPGPVVFVTGAVHGDELNGMAAVQGVVRDGLTTRLQRGALILVPVVNIQGFERRSRYLPDRRDLNRSFPGNANGSGASRLARHVFDEIVEHADYGIDIHTGSNHRTNFPNVRGDQSHEGVQRISVAFGTEVILDAAGPRGSLRRAATEAGKPTIVFEGGEVGKAEPGVAAVAVRGVENVLVELGMVESDLQVPRYQAVARESSWVRSDYGGILNFHVSPGEIVEEDQPLATCTGLLADPAGTVCAPQDGIVIGMTTQPAVTPGDPICHIAVPVGGVGRLQAVEAKDTEQRLLDEVREQLATNLVVSDAD